MDGTIQASATAAKEVIPLINLYGLAAALLFESILFMAVVWLLGRHVLKLSGQLTDSLTVTAAQAKAQDGMTRSQEGMARQLGDMGRSVSSMLITVGVLADRAGVKRPIVSPESGEKG